MFPDVGNLIMFPNVGNLLGQVIEVIACPIHSWAMELLCICLQMLQAAELLHKVLRATFHNKVFCTETCS